MDVEHSKNLYVLYLADLSQYVILYYMSIVRLLLLLFLQRETSVEKIIQNYYRA